MKTRALTRVPEILPAEYIDLSKLDRKQLKFLKSRAQSEDIHRFLYMGADAGLNAIRLLLASPVASLVAAYFLIEWAQREGYMPSMAGTILEGALITEAALKSISDSGILTTILPLIGALKA